MRIEQQKGRAMKTGLIALVLVAVTACGSAPKQTELTLRNSAVQAPVAAGFADALNAFRASQGLSSIRNNGLLARAATAHAADMERRGYFSHRSVGGPNGDGLVARAASAGCAIRFGAENIAQGQRSELEVFAAWQNSPGHRRNLLGSQYTEYGLGRFGNTWVMKLSSGC